MRDRPEAVMMFAAGFGTRMKHLTANQPKPLIQVAGKPLIDHALDLTHAIQPKHLVANLHYKAEMLEDHLHPLNVETLTELPDILETGGGLRNALPLLGDGPVFTMNTDAIWRGANPLKLLLDAWDGSTMDALLIAVPPDQAVGYSGSGDFTIDIDGRLTRGPGLIYGGIQIIKTDLLATIPETAFSLNRIWDLMLERQRLFGLTYDGHWCDVGHPQGVALAENMLSRADV
ncbi:nucleotidyltransferase [Sulfitobacter sp. SK012]|uniref:nucleotidyltransferase family protein n=1 Tax=Sulfitobacter sp. SK012 TaxID=1389005 RepID=UPI000E0C08FE|nr:nucleotidyltransferase family protein [Sulfitobacter sp. SK012]AXI44603.1 nucleotidyltransferase [Sulfitobacter sp. SK012]